MPRLVEMNWVASRGQWRRFYRGQTYYVSPRQLGCEPTQQASVVAANEWWKKKKAEIDGRTIDPANRLLQRANLDAGELQRLSEEGERARRLLGLLRDAEAFGADCEVKDVPAVTLPDGMVIPAGEVGVCVKEGAIPDAIAHLHNGGSLPLEAIDRALIPEGRKARVLPEETRVERLAELLADAATAAPRENSVGCLVEMWLEGERRRVLTGQVGESRTDDNRICLCHFRDWIGESTPVSAVTGTKWLAWYGFLGEQRKLGRWGDYRCGRIMDVAKRFVRFCWELELLELPRNLDNPGLSFTNPPKEIEVCTEEELARLWSAVKNQSRLHVLLMLNCGMLAKDINDLRQDEVDWAGGVITRKRSKASKNDAVPVVRYKLWGRTFEELKKWRSDDAEVALLTQTGQRWIQPKQKEGAWQRSDCIASALRVYLRRAKVDKPPKALRATAATKMGEHPTYKFYAQYFLGHSPRGIAEKHYVKPSEKEFFQALAWLEKALGLA